MPMTQIPLPGIPVCVMGLPYILAEKLKVYFTQEFICVTTAHLEWKYLILYRFLGCFSPLLLYTDFCLVSSAAPLQPS